MAIEAVSRETRWNVVLLGLFLASGCSALIYEVVWFQQLSLILGASAVSLSILLACFMGGMCVGSLGFARWVSDRRHPLRVYAVLELLIAVCGLGTLWLFPLIEQVYCRLSFVGSSDLVARSLVAISIMLPPTAMMGATLPAIARAVPPTRTGLAWLGWYYGANTFGAVAGCLIAGMALLRFGDVSIATFVAAAINASIAVIAFGMAKWSCSDEVSQSAQSTAAIGGLRMNPVHIVAALSGLTALGAEAIWTRHLALVLGPTVYTFSIVLAIFLLGLGLGSCAGAEIGRHVRSPRLALAVAQLLLLVAIPYAAYLIVYVVPYWLVLRGADELLTVRMTRDVIRTLVVLFPATMLWGAQFSVGSGGFGTQKRR